jgi:hypothetical protein
MWATFIGTTVLVAITAGMAVWCWLDVRASDKRELEALNIEYNELLTQETSK